MAAPVRDRLERARRAIARAAPRLFPRAPNAASVRDRLRRARRVLARVILRVLQAAGLAIVFAAALAAGAVLHGSVPAARRLFARAAERAFARELSGALAIERVERIGLGSVSGVDLVVTDPEGQRVLRAEDVDARIALVPLFRSVVSGGLIDARLPRVTIDGAEIAIEEDAHGDIGLARAFSPRAQPSGEGERAARDREVAAEDERDAVAAARDVAVEIEAIAVRRARAAVRARALERAEATASDVTASASLGPAGASIAVTDARVEARGLPVSEPLRGRFEGTLDVPDGEEPPRAWLAFDGALGAIVASARASAKGARVEAAFDLRIPPPALAELAPGADAADDVFLHASVRGALPHVEVTARASLASSSVDVTGTVAAPDGSTSAWLADLRFRIADFDASAVRATLWPSRLDASGSAALRLEAGRAEARLDARIEPGAIAGHVTPAARIAGTIAGSEARFEGRLAEPGAPTTFAFVITPDPSARRSARIARFETRTVIPRLDRVVRFNRPNCSERNERNERDESDGCDERGGPLVAGRAVVTTRGRLDPDAGRFEASLRVRLDRVRGGPARLRRGTIDARARGSLDAPHVRATVDGHGLAMGPARFDRARAEAKATPRGGELALRLRGRNAPDVEARAHVAPIERAEGGLAGVAIERARATLSRRGVQASVRADRIELTGGLLAEGIDVRGLGEPLHARLRVRDEAFALRLAAPAIDLGRAARLFGSTGREASGVVSAHADVATARGSPHGRVETELREASIAALPPASGTISIDTIEAANGSERYERNGRSDANEMASGVAARLEASASVRGIGWIRVLAPELRLPRRPFARRALDRVTGAVHATAVLDLEALARTTNAPVSAGGTGDVQVTISRAAPGIAPDFDVALTTHGLAFGPERRDEGRSAERGRSVDLRLAARLAGESGEARLAVTLATKDQAIGTLEARAVLPTSAIARGERVRREAIGRIPVYVSLNVRRLRALAWPLPLPPSLGDALGPALAASEIAARATVTGTLGAPRAQLDARASNLRAPVEARLAPFDARFAASYDGATAHWSAAIRGARAFSARVPLEAGLAPIDARSAISKGAAAASPVAARGAQPPRRTAPISARGTGNAPAADLSLDAEGTVHVRAADWLARDPARPLPWEASAVLRARAFPIEILQPLLETRIRGRLSGSVELVRLHAVPDVDARLEACDLRIDTARFPRARARVLTSNGELFAAVRLEQHEAAPTLGHARETRSPSSRSGRTRSARGYLVGGARAAVRWDGGIRPTIERARPARAWVEACALRASVLLPLLEGPVDRLDGRLDGRLDIALGPDGIEQVDGALTLRDGVVELPALGEELRAIRARALFDRRGLVRIDDVAAESAAGGSVRAAGWLELDGLSLRRAAASFLIPRDRPMPLTVQGVSFGRASGRIEARAERTAESGDLDVTIDAPTLRVALPSRGGRSLQPLDDDPHIATGVRLPNGTFVRLPLGPPSEGALDELAARIAIRFGSDVWIERAALLRAKIEGRLVAELDGETRLEGELAIERGTIDVLGKRFAIDRGTLVFHPDEPDNPSAVVTAYWDAPGGKRVFVDFVGPLQSAAVTLRSDPPLSEDEIVALVVYGSSDAAPGIPPSWTGETDATVRAAGFAGGLLSRAIHEVLGGRAGPLDLAARVDTSEAGNPRPGLVVQLSQSLSAEVSYALGVPAPGRAPDRTELTLEWRLFRGFSLQATIGDQGSTSFDVIWRKRY